MSLLTQAIIASLVMYIAWIDNNFTHVWTYRPIVLGPLMGFCMGNLSIGLEVGATVELMYLATVWVGTATPPNETLAAGIGTALAVVTGDVTIAIAAALPIGIIGGSLVTLRQTVLDVLTLKMYEKEMAKGNRKGMIFWAVFVPTFVINFVLFVVPTFVAVYFGADVCTQLLESIPENVLAAINCGGKMIGAVGLALLLKMIGFNRAWPFFFLGFIFSAYLGVGNLGITILGVVTVGIIYMFKEKGITN